MGPMDAIGGAFNAMAGGGAAGGIDGAIAQMEGAFNTAIASAAEVTALTTVKKAELDASKQRPNL